MAKIDDIIERYNELKTARGTIENSWQECLKYILPRKAYITRVKTSGQKMDTDIYDCFDKETEVLTKSGWKKFDEVQYEDKVLSLNPKTGVAEYYPIEEIIIQDYSGKLKQFDSNAINFAVTPNHKLLVRGDGDVKLRNSPDWKIQKVSDIKIKRFYLKRDFIWEGKEQAEIEIKNENKGSAKSYEFKMDDWLEFLGWFVSEGFTFYNKEKKTSWVNICQSAKTNPDKCSEIKTLLQRMGLSNGQYSDFFFRFGSRAIAEHLNKYVGIGASNKRIPEYVKNLSSRQLRIFLESYRKGDGYKVSSGENRYNTCSKLLADDVQELILKTGSYARISIRDNRGRKVFLKDHWVETKHLDYLILEYTNDRKSYDVTVLLDKIKDVFYDDKIYCVTVKPYHLIYVRKNGACFWSGNSTAIQANVTLAAGLHGYLTNPATKWFAIRTQDRDLMKQKEVMLWLKNAEDKMHDAINASNFAQQVHEVYLDLGSIGTACLYEDENIKDIVRFYCFSMGDIFISENEYGEVDLIIRKTNLTVRQAYRLWGEKSGESVRREYAAKNYEKKTDIIHAVMPRWERDVSKEDAINFPFASVYIEVSQKHQISEGGYQEFPFFVPKFTKESGETYGTSPGMVSLPDIKMLNSMSKTIIRSAQKIVDPPLVLPDDGFILPIKVNPASINFRTPNGMNPNAKIEPILTGGRIDIGMEMENQRRETIKRNFFADLFLLLANNPNMTATEVLQRVQEKMLMLAPVLGRLMSELLDPIIERTFNIMFRLGLFGQPPEALSGIKYVIEYTSPLARAQKAEELKNMNNIVALMGQIAAFKPDIADKLNVDEYVNVSAELGSINPRIILDDREVKLLRDARLEAQAQQAELEQAATMASAGKDAGQMIASIREPKK